MNPMRVRGSRLLLMSIMCVGIVGCSEKNSGHDNLNAILWVQSSAEYAATTTAVYAAATSALDEIVAGQPDSISQMVVIMDVDDTVLDNSRYRAHQMFEQPGKRGVTWDQWSARMEGTSIPGATEFVRSSQELGVRVQFISNRRCRDRGDGSGICPQREETLSNLSALGINIESDALYLRYEPPPEHCMEFLTDSERQVGMWASNDKTSRRQCVAHEYNVVMIIGDQLGDFVAWNQDETIASRSTLMEQSRENWGRTWFVIPNPTTGAWLKILAPGELDHVQTM